MRQLSKYVGYLLAGLLGGGVVGYHFKARELESRSSIPSLDYFTPDESFSEIHNAKAALSGLLSRFLTEIQAERCLQLEDSSLGAGTMSFPGRPYPEQLINQLEWGFEQFRGTEEELTLANHLLRALRANAQYDRWVGTYLTLLYEHPTDEFVATHAQEAIGIAARVGRDKEVLDGLRHVDEIPLTFRAKAEVQKALVQLQNGASVAANMQIGR